MSHEYIGTFRSSRSAAEAIVRDIYATDLTKTHWVRMLNYDCDLSKKRPWRIKRIKIEIIPKSNREYRGVSNEELPTLFYFYKRNDIANFESLGGKSERRILDIGFHECYQNKLDGSKPDHTYHYTIDKVTVTRPLCIPEGFYVKKG